MKTTITKFAVAAVALGAVMLPIIASAQTPMHQHNPYIQARLANQHSRIRQGLLNGQLSQQQANRLNARDNRIDRTMMQERNANGGHLTAAERGKMEMRLNRSSRKVYNRKHDVTP